MKIKFFLVFLFILNLIILFDSCKALISEIYLLPVSSLVEKSIIKNVPLKFSLNLEERLEVATRLEPKNADYWRVRGKYFLLKGNSGEEGARLDAQHFFSKALHYEPASAYSWVLLALAHSEPENLSKDFYKAFEKAFQYGGWEYGQLKSLMSVGLVYWDILDVSARLVLKTAIQRMYEMNRKDTLEFMNDSKHVHMLCIWLRNAPKSSWLCRKELGD